MLLTQCSQHLASYALAVPADGQRSLNASVLRRQSAADCDRERRQHSHTKLETASGKLLPTPAASHMHQVQSYADAFAQGVAAVHQYYGPGQLCLHALAYRHADVRMRCCGAHYSSGTTTDPVPAIVSVTEPQPCQVSMHC
jgi:hypothetical protein